MMRVLMCNACRTVVHRISNDVKFLVETEQMWEQPDLNARLHISCDDPHIPGGDGSMREACELMMSTYQKQMAKQRIPIWTKGQQDRCGGDDEVQIFIKSVTGKTITLSILPGSTVEEVKAMIQDKEGIPSGRTRLTHNGRPMREEDSMRAHNVGGESTLQASIRLCGRTGGTKKNN